MKIQSRMSLRSGIMVIAALMGSASCLPLPPEEDARHPGRPEDDLVAVYTFDGNAQDCSGHRIHGIVHGAVLTDDGSGKKDSAYLFDGLDDYITFVQVLPDMREMTVCAMVYAENDVNFFNDGDWAIGNDVTLGVGPRSVNVRADKGRYGLRDGIHVGIEMMHHWRHIAWTATPDESDIYIDGSHKATVGRGGCNIGYHNFILGTHEYPKGVMGFGGYWKGKISSLRIYSRILNSEEVEKLHARGG